MNTPPSASHSVRSCVRLHAGQILFEVMNGIGQCNLPVCYDNGTELGIISLGDIMIFLEHKPEKNLYYHKLNYTLESLLALKSGILQELFKDTGQL